MTNPRLNRPPRWLAAPLAAGTVLALVMPGAAARGATTNPKPNKLERVNAALSRQAAASGMVLLENRDNALPMAKGGNVAVYGPGAYKTAKGGTGSGDVNNRYTISVRQGLVHAGYKITTGSAYWTAMTAAYDAQNATSGPAVGGLAGPVNYAKAEQLLTPTTVKPTARTTTAVYVLSRQAGEGADRTDTPGDYLLTDTEKADIALIGKTYRHVVIVLNTGGIMDTTWFKSINAREKDPAHHTALDSLLLMSQAGEESGNALAEVLDGKVDPSGHLTDTWASKYSYYPASKTFGANDGNTDSEAYSEGLYVGYRYFDSFYKTLNPAHPNSVISYPFGYGLSYTHFAIAVKAVHANASKVTVQAKVTNTGTRSGQEVVQVYFSAPKTGVDKPYQELAAYGKTDLLAPGKSQTLTLSYDTTQMSSFDTKKSEYVMSSGAYLVRVGDSSRNTHVAAALALVRSVVTQKVNHEMDGAASSNDLHSKPANFYRYAAERKEILHAPVVVLDAKSVKTVNSRSPYEQSVAVPSTSPYSAIDGSLISSTTADVPTGQTSWEGTGAPYAAKTGETVQSVATKSGATLYDVAQGTVSMQQFVAGLSVTQLGNLVEGLGFIPSPGSLGSTPSAIGAAGYTTATLQSLGIPSMVLSDGPAGLRITQQIPTTPPTYQWATDWPIGTLLAQTWDRDLLQRVGDGIGKEMLEYGATMWLAPGMNIHRDPLNGRNFEYYSEDPLIAGLAAAATTIGVQSNPGVGVTIKHFVANNQEANRNAVDESISERALREIYLKGFEYTVRSAQPMAVMSSYNKENGTWSSMNYDLLTDILRGEWHFKGVVMSDWGGSHSATASMYSGNDLIEPGGNPAEVIDATKKVSPTIDVTGLPAYNATILTFGSFSFTSYAYSLGSLNLSASGDQTITTTVNASTNLAQVPLSGTTGGSGTFTPNAPYGTVDAAYKAVNALLANPRNGLSADQKAGITLTNVVHATPGDATSPVTAYTISLKGSDKVDLRLGDLQRSATHILNVAMQSTPFAQLAAQHGVSGIAVRSYTKQFSDLKQFVTVRKSPVVGRRS